MECNHTALPNNNATYISNDTCVNWNIYYTECKGQGNNPFQGTISFDNIGLAWVAIFLVSRKKNFLKSFPPPILFSRFKADAARRSLKAYCGSSRAKVKNNYFSACLDSPSSLLPTVQTFFTDSFFSVCAGYKSGRMDGHNVLRARRSLLLGLDLFCPFDRRKLTLD